MRVGYLIPEFPIQTHILFWREFVALEEMGFELDLLSTRRPSEDTSRHAFTEAAIARTTYLVPLQEPLRAMGYLLRHPVKSWQALAYAAGLKESPWKDRLRSMALILPAAALVLRGKDMGLAHLHVHSYANSAHLAAMARILGGPSYSLTLHGHLPVYGRDHGAKSARAAFVTTVTDDLARTMRTEIGVDPVVITMGVDAARFTPVPPPPAPPLRLVTVARLNVVKGHVYVLRALAELLAEGHALHYTIAGEGPHRPEIEAEIARLDLGAHVTLAGALSEDAVLALLQASHVHVLASIGLGEASPVVVKEAMACALPVVVTRIGGTEEMITDGVDGLLVPQKDSPAIAAALRRLILDPDLRAHLGTTARERAIRQFDFKALAARMGELFRAYADR